MGNGCCGRGSTKVRAPPSEKRAKLFINLEFEQSFLEWSTPSSGKSIRWKRGELISEGQDSKTYQCMNIETGELLAVRHLRLSSDTIQLQKEFSLMSREVQLLRRLDHPHIVKYYQTDLSPDICSLDILLEYVPGGSLKQLLNRYGSLPEDIIKSYARQLAHGLAYLHSNGVVHRNLKPSNLLLCPNGQIKISDLGASKLVDSEGSINKNCPFWMAPEIANNQYHSSPSDIWSFGCILAQMASGRTPWSEFTTNPKDVLLILNKSETLPRIPKCSGNFKQVIRACLQREPEMRPTAQDLLLFEFVVEPASVSTSLGNTGLSNY